MNIINTEDDKEENNNAASAEAEPTPAANLVEASISSSRTSSHSSSMYTLLFLWILSWMMDEISIFSIFSTNDSFAVVM